MKIWFKIWKDGRIGRSTVIEDYSEETRTHKVFNALDAACRELDLARPIWLDAAVNEFKRHARCRFGQDAFIEQIEFDYLEMHVLEED